VAEAPAAAPAVDDGNALDFDFELPGAAAAVEPEPAAEAPVDDGNALQFDPSALSLDSLGAEESVPVAEASEEAVEAAPAPVSDDTVLDFSFDDLPAAEEAPAAVESAEPVELPEVAEPAAEATGEAVASEDLIAFDLPEVAEPAAEEPAAASSSAMVDLDRLEPVPMSDELAADLARVQSMHAEAEQAAADSDTLLDFDLGGEAAAEAPSESAAADAETLLELPPLDEEAAPATELPTPSFDLSAISLDLDVPPAAEEGAAESVELPELAEVAEVAEVSEIPEVAEPAVSEGHDSDLLHSLASSVAADEVDLSTFETAGEPMFAAAPVPEAGHAAAPAADADTPRWQEVETKLDLAKAYEEMGDVEGARELLSEVISEGDAAQQSKARDMLEHLLG
jgi:pilus assembly protein FimV